jgi:DNA-binding transcriptional ArsR family regulator
MATIAAERPAASAEGCDQVLAELDVAAQKLKVCGHPVRLRLLCMIAREEDPCVSELWSCLNQPQPVISQHLAVLKEKGIVKSEVSGNRRIYSIVDPFIRDIVATLNPCNHA